MRDSPNAKMYLRSFWYRATQQGVVGADDMHVYTAASFLLQLALLDLPCAAFAPSRLAAAALSLSLGTFGKPAWPAALQRFGSYEAADLQAPRRQLAAAQASRAASQLRRIWTAQYEDHGYAECAEQWLHVRCLLACPSRLLPDVGPERGEPEAPGYAPSGIPPPPLGGGPAGTTAAVLV
jgi:cyclin A